METPTIIDINNIARWLDEESGEAEDNSIDVSKYIACVVPPFDHGIFKYTAYMPKAVYVGVMMTGVQITDDIYDEFEEIWEKQFSASAPREAAWVVNFKVYLDDREDLSNSGKVGEMSMLLDKNGSDLKNGASVKVEKDVMESPAGEEAVKHTIVQMVIPVVIATSLLHCKNVQAVDKKVTRAQKRRAKRTGQPIVIEKVLEVDGFRRQVERSGGEGTSIQRALHICRGHFREYSEEKPLFGKYAGRYWVPQHTRGNQSVGKVRKSYKVNEGGAEGLRK